MKFSKFFLIPLATVFILLCSFKASNTSPQNDPFIVVLDAGHGGHDPGNLGNGYMEKNIALNIVLNVGKRLSTNPGIKVIYTRKDDSFVDLFVRGEIANKANADLFVSVHCDSHTSDANGAGTFVLGLHANKQNFEIAKKENSVIYLEDNYESRYAAYDINSPESVIGLTIMQEEFLDQSIMLAKMMQDNFSNHLSRNDRKVKQAGFIVLHQTFMPSVLIETGFLTNKSEGLYLNSEKGQEEMGQAIADAIVNYKNNTRVNLEDAASSKEVTTTKAEEAVAAKEITTTAAEDAAAAAVIASQSVEGAETQLSKEATQKELKEAIVVASGDENKTEKPEAVGEKPDEIPEKKEELLEEEIPPLKKEVAQEEVTEREVTLAEVPETTPAVEKKKEEVKKEELVSDSQIIFKVQLLASSRVLPLVPEEFNGLSSLSTERYKNLVRYMYGKTNSYSQAQLYKENADAKGYSSSYIVAYKGGVRIPLTEALKYVSE